MCKGGWLNLPASTVLLLFLLFLGCACWSCQFDATDYSLKADRPMPPYSNCFDYCKTYFSEYPQRAYYNIHTKRCQPQVHCALYGENTYYENACYTDTKRQAQIKSILQPRITDPQLPVKQQHFVMVCVNGIIIKNIIEGQADRKCLCQILWVSSGRYDMSGNPIYCDRVTDDPTLFFQGRISQDNDGKIVKYGSYNAQQINIMLATLKRKQRRQRLHYVLSHYESALYALDLNLPKQPLVSGTGYILLFVAIYLVYIMILMTYVQSLNLRILATEDRLRQKVRQTVENSGQVQNQL